MWDVLIGQATSFKRSKHGQRLHRLCSPFLYFSQHLVLHVAGTHAFCTALWCFLAFFFFFPITYIPYPSAKILTVMRIPVNSKGLYFSK